MICIYSPTNTDYTHNGDATLIPIRCELSMSINGAWQLTLEHPYDPEERYKYITEGAVLRVDINSVREQTTTRQRFRVYQYTKGLNSVTAIAFPIAMESTYDAPIDNLVLTAKTGAQAMSDINTKIGTSKYTLSSDIATVKSASYSNTNANSVIAGGDANCFIKVWGGEIIYDNYKYSVKQRLGDTNENNHKIQYGRNLSSIDLQKDDSGLTTRIYPISADGIRLNGSGYVDSSHVSDYPVVHHRFMTAPYNLIEQNETSNSATAVLTRTALQAVSTQASTLAQAAYDEAIDQGVQPDFINKNRNEIVKAVQNMALASVLSTSYYQACANVIANAMAFLDEVEQPEWTWHGDAETGYWYGNEDGYAKNMYVKISKTWSYFGNDGIWQEPRDDKGTWDWYQDSTGKKYGNFEKYFAHNEYVYITMDGTLTCYWFNEEGWYESEYTKASSWTWHGSGTAEDPYWFGEEDAGDNSKKYAHDCWIFIDGVYYFFDSYGYYDGSTKFEDYQWDWVKSDERYWFGNAEDKTYAATYLVSQWAKINGDWYYFDANGYAELKNESIARVNTIFTTEMAALATTVNTQMAALYTLLYQLMTAWCTGKFAEGIDQPMLTITVDMVDLSKTTEYEGFTDLVNIKLGDSVKCEDYEHDIIYSNRVIGLTYDCIRDFNKAVVIGTAVQTVAQILGNASGQANASGFDTTAIDNQLQAQNAAIGALQNGKQDKLTAGANISIVNNVISATGGGLQYWHETANRFYREGIHEGLSADGYIYTSCNWNNYVSGLIQGYEYQKLTEEPAIMAEFGHGLNQAIAIVGLSENAVKWQWRVRQATTDWLAMSGYPATMYNVSFTYNGTTWYASVIKVLASVSNTGTVDGLSSIDTTIMPTDDDEGAIYLAKHFIDVENATDEVDVVCEIGTQSYAFKYGGADKTYAYVDTDGNALFKEITTDAGTLTNQMEAKQDNLIAGANIQIGADGKTISATDTTYEEFDGDEAGLVPAVETQSGKFLKDDGTWATPSGGGGSANIVELTQAEYDALPSSKLSDDTLYMVYFDGGQTLDPNYNYYKYGENDEIVVRVYHEGQADQEVLWFFNNWTATAFDNSIPTELQTWKPTNTQPIYSDSYAEVGGTQTSWVGFYDNSIRSWNITLATSYIGVVNAVVNPFPTSAGQQTNGYYSPYVYIQDSPPFTKIYYNNHEYTHKVTANPSEAATETLQKLEVDGIVYGVSGGSSGGGSDVLYSGLSVGQITLSESIEDYSLIIAVINEDQYSTYQLTGQYSPSLVTTYSNTSIFIISPYGLNDGFYRYKFSDDTHMVWDDGRTQQQSMVVIGIK